jgi:hypothetical protein
MVPPVQPPILCSAADYNPRGARGPRKERAKLARDLRERILQSPEAVELQNRLRDIDDGQKRAYMLPYHLLLYKDGFRLGVPQPAGYYSFDRQLSARHLREICSAGEAEQKVVARLHEYVLNPDLAWEYVSASYASFALHCIKEDLAAVGKALVAPLQALASLLVRR